MTDDEALERVKEFEQQVRSMQQQLALLLQLLEVHQPEVVAEIRQRQLGRSS